MSSKYFEFWVVAVAAAAFGVVYVAVEAPLLGAALIGVAGIIGAIFGPNAMWRYGFFGSPGDGWNDGGGGSSDGGGDGGGCGCG